MKDFPGYEGLYAVEEDGRVWSYQYNKYMSPADNGHGYLELNLSDRYGNKKKWRINRMVALTYLPAPKPG
jgi:hypothetical protein